MPPKKYFSEEKKREAKRKQKRQFEIRRKVNKELESQGIIVPKPPQLSDEEKKEIRKMQKRDYARRKRAKKILESKSGPSSAPETPPFNSFESPRTPPIVAPPSAVIAQENRELNLVVDGWKRRYGAYQITEPGSFRLKRNS